MPEARLSLQSQLAQVAVQGTLRMDATYPCRFEFLNLTIQVQSPT